MKKTIILTLIMAMLILSLACLSACGDNTDDDGSDDGSSSGNDGGEMIVGVVTEDVSNNRIAIQTQRGEDYVVNVYPSETEVFGKNGAEISYLDIKKGDHVKVTHNGMVTRSIPPQVTATRIEVIDGASAKSGIPEAETYSMRARVKEIDGGMLVEVISSDYASGDYFFYVGEETTVYDNTGAVVAFSYVRVGDVVNVVYGNAVTLSLPPKTNAIRIVVE